jgi:hypothetical protein
MLALRRADRARQNWWWLALGSAKATRLGHKSDIVVPEVL